MVNFSVDFPWFLQETFDPDGFKIPAGRVASFNFILTIRYYMPLGSKIG
jgi:hypothetical protein